MHKILVAILAMSMAAGCTTTRSFNSISASSAEEIEPGKTAIIEFVDGSSQKVEIGSYGQTSLEAVTADGTVRHIDYADVRTIRAKQLSGRKTAGVVTLALLAFGISSALNDIAFFPSGP